FVSVSDWLRNGTQRNTTSPAAAAGPFASPEKGPSPSRPTVSRARSGSREPITTGTPAAPRRRASPKPKAPDPPRIVTGSGVTALARRLGELTTLRTGGPAARLVEARTEAELVGALRAAPPPLLVLGGGSNVLIADEGFSGTVVHVATRGVEADGERLVVQAG